MRNKEFIISVMLAVLIVCLLFSAGCKKGPEPIPIPNPPTLQDPGGTDTDGNYTVTWTSSVEATNYRLQEAQDNSFRNPSEPYDGPGTSKPFTGKPNGHYYYRVRAENQAGASGWSNIEDIVVDRLDLKPPSKPANPDPDSAAIEVAIGKALSWSGGVSPAGHQVKFKVHFGRSKPPAMVDTVITSRYDPPGEMHADKEYFWRIGAWDTVNDSVTYGNIWDFTTEEGNIYPPTPLHDPTPEDSDTGVALDTDLRWEGGDSPQGYDVFYIIHFDTIPDPRVVDTVNVKMYDPPGNLDSSTTYHWKIVAQDENDSSTTGNPWLFTTIGGEPPCSIAVTDPQSGDSLLVESEHDIRWTSSGTSGQVKIDLYKGGSFLCEIAPCPEDDDGSYDWTVDDCDSGPASDYRIKITDCDNSTCSGYTGYFTIVPEPPCTITVTSPESGDTLVEGSEHHIRWTSSGTSGSVDIDLYKGGTLLCGIASDAEDNGSYSWTVDHCGGGAGSDYYIKIRDSNNSSCYDNSDYFTINVGCTITVTDPHTGDSWDKGTNHYIRWNRSGDCSNVKIELYKGSSFLCTIDDSEPNDSSYVWTVDDCGGGTASNYRVKITCLDNTCSDYSDYFTINVCDIQVTQPRSGDSWDEGTTEVIQWSGHGLSASVDIDLYKGTTLLCRIVSSTNDVGYYYWTVDDCGGGTASNYRIKISDSNNSSCYDYSDYFTIKVCDIEVTQPRSGDSWDEGTTEVIQWSGHGFSGYVDIKLYKGTSLLCTIVSHTSDVGSYSWMVDDCGGGTASNYRIKISDSNNSSCYDYSGYFTIKVCDIEITRPRSGDTWGEGTRHNILWNGHGFSASVDIDLYKGTTLLCRIVSSTNDVGYYYWTVDDCGGGPASNYRIKISDSNNSSCYDYSEYFEIAVPVWLEITFYPDSPRLDATGNYPPEHLPLDTSGVMVYFDDPSWSGCSTPGGHVHARLNPWWLIPAYIYIFEEGQSGVYVDQSANSLTFTVTADFKNMHPDDRWLVLCFGTCKEWFRGTQSCDDYTSTFSRSGCGSGPYYLVELFVHEENDEVAVAKIRIDFNGWYGNYGLSRARGVVEITDDATTTSPEHPRPK